MEERGNFVPYAFVTSMFRISSSAIIISGKGDG
jgi:hypothetical protein